MSDSALTSASWRNWVGSIDFAESAEIPQPFAVLGADHAWPQTPDHRTERRATPSPPELRSTAHGASATGPEGPNHLARRRRAEQHGDRGGASGHPRYGAGLARTLDALSTDPLGRARDRGPPPRCPTRRQAVEDHCRRDLRHRSHGLRGPQSVGTTHHSLDPARDRRRGDQTRHRRADLPAPCGANFKKPGTSNRTWSDPG